MLPSPAPELPEVGEIERTRLQYRISNLSTGPHLVSFWRERLARMGVTPSHELPNRHPGDRVLVAGVVITRQAPSTANRIRFFTLEDEFGHVNVTIKPEVYEKYRQTANLSPALVIEAVMQSQDGVWSVLAREIRELALPRDRSRSHDYK